MTWKEKLRELDFRVEERTNIVSISLRSWFKSFIFMVLWVGLNTFGETVSTIGRAKRSCISVYCEEVGFRISAIWRQTTSVLHQHLSWSSGTSVNWQKTDQLIEWNFCELAKTVLLRLFKVSEFYAVAKCRKIWMPSRKRENPWENLSQTRWS